MPRRNPAIRALLRPSLGPALGLALCPALGLALAAPPASPAAADGRHRIAAIVNDDIISRRDVDARVGLVILFAGMRDGAGVRERLGRSVLRTLIDERLKLQEAEGRGVSVPRRDIDQEVARFAGRHNLGRDGLERLLRERGLSMASIEAQVRSELAWARVVRRRFVPRVAIGDEEIQEEIDHIAARQGQTEYHLEEIALAVDSPGEDARVRAGARRLAEEIRRGARFSTLARQFSQSATAAVGGDLGWIGLQDVDGPLRDVVAGMGAGDVSEPVRTAAGYRIVRLAGKRRVAEAAGGDTLSLRQLLLPLAADAPGGAARRLAGRAADIARRAAGCDDFDRLGRAAGARTSPPRTVREGRLPPAVRALVDGVPAGVASAPTRVREGVTVLMVCSRERPGITLPDRREVADRLLQQRLSLLARQHLRNLRLSAVIDVRA